MIDKEIDEIHKIRLKIDEKCDHDLHKVIAYYREIEGQLKKSGLFQFEGCVAVSKPDSTYRLSDNVQGG